jgi:hypothetical protein
MRQRIYDNNMEVVGMWKKHEKGVGDSGVGENGNGG